ncbi:SPFH domain-containing protein [Microbacterium marinilacus]|nr:flotillin family protein [Microbacterium marinilacus]MBY0689960.1 flotillin family protein [Microbacterium marinilacus]
MDPFSLLFTVGPIAVGAVILALIILLLFRAWYRIAKADEALVIVGKNQRGADGETSRITVVTGGGAIVNPITQRAELISLRARQINVEPTAQSSNGVTVDVTGVALFKIGSDADQVRRAAERFASQDGAIEQFTREQLEGSLRGVVAMLTVEQLMRDRQQLSDQIAENIKGDLEAQGLILDSFQIQGITDKNGYIEALGASEIERVKRDAQVASITAQREVQRNKIATDEQNLVEYTAYQKNTANAKAEIGRANAEAEAAEKLAREKLEQGVLEQAAMNQAAKLDAEVRRVAEAAAYERQQRADAEAYEQQKAADAEAYSRIKEAEAQAKIAEQKALEVKTRAAADAETVRLSAEADAGAQRAAGEAAAFVAQQDAQGTKFRAEADAEAIRLAGDAKASAIKAEAAAIAEHEEALMAQRAIEAVVPMMAEFAKGYQRVGSITVLGGEGGASAHLASEQAVGMRATFDAVKAATGVDLGAIISGRAVGEGIGEGIRAAGGADAAAPAAKAPARRPAAAPADGPEA